MAFASHIRIAFLVVVASVYAPRAAEADPVITYDQASGNLRIAYDGLLHFQGSDQLFVVQFESASKSLKQPLNWPTEWQSSPAVLKVDELPGLLTVFSIPMGVTNLPGVLEPGTSVHDLTALIFNPSPWVQEFVPIIEVPEPSTIALGGISLLSLAALRRRK